MISRPVLAAFALAAPIALLVGDHIVSKLESSAADEGEPVDFAKEIEPWLGERAGAFFEALEGKRPRRLRRDRRNKRRGGGCRVSGRYPRLHARGRVVDEFVVVAAALRLADSLISESGFEEAKKYLKSIRFLALGSASRGDLATAKPIVGLK